jgi:hypothetical protein
LAHLVFTISASNSRAPVHLLSTCENFRPKFWFTSETPLPSFGSDFGPLLPPPVTHNSTRKQFFAKLLGAVSMSALLPKLFGKSAAAGSTAVSSGSTARAFELRHDARAVARRDVA